MSTSRVREIERIPVGVPGFDIVAAGGLPRGRSTMVVGSSGSGKTVFAMQCLAAGVTEYDESGVLVTLEERPEDLIRNVESFGWDFGALVEAGRIVVVDASPSPDDDLVHGGAFDLGGLLARIDYAAERAGATRVVIDSIGGIFAQLSDRAVVRTELSRLIAALRHRGFTTIVTAERVEEYGPVARYGVEEFVADNVVIMRNVLEGEKRRRTLEILKLRGADHLKGEFPYSIDPEQGITVIPLSAIDLDKQSAVDLISLGTDGLDRMMGGGLYRDAIMLVSGGTGTGKTLLSSRFMEAAWEGGERGVLFSFEESRHQLIRNAASWGVDLRGAVDAGAVSVVAQYSERKSLEDLLLQMRREIDAFGPGRVAIDGLTILERTSSERAFREFVVGLMSYLKSSEIAGVMTATTRSLIGGTSIIESHISTLADAVLLMRHVEDDGDLRRVIAVLKARGVGHDRHVREYVIDGEGMQIGEPYRGAAAILS